MKKQATKLKVGKTTIMLLSQSGKKNAGAAMKATSPPIVGSAACWYTMRCD